MKMLVLLAAVATLSAAPLGAGSAGSIGIVAAENFYGDIARQVGGAAVKVEDILSNPDQDPHLFEPSPSVARAISAARIVVYNGIGYDPWMDKLLGASKASGRKVIVVAELVGRKGGDNPHIWYDPTTMPLLARALAAELIAADPAHQGEYRGRLERFGQSMQPVQARIAALRGRVAGVPVTATEPVFGDMFAALGLQVRNLRLQLAVMNNTEPGASDVAAFETDLRTRQVRLLVYNSQATDPIAARMRTLATASHIPVVGVTETEPAGKTYQDWMLGELDAIDHALSD